MGFEKKMGYIHLQFRLGTRHVLGKGFSVVPWLKDCVGRGGIRRVSESGSNKPYKSRGDKSFDPGLDLGAR